MDSPTGTRQYRNTLSPSVLIYWRHRIRLRHRANLPKSGSDTYLSLEGWAFVIDKRPDPAEIECPRTGPYIILGDKGVNEITGVWFVQHFNLGTGLKGVERLDDRRSRTRR